MSTGLRVTEALNFYFAVITRPIAYLVNVTLDFCAFSTHIVQSKVLRVVLRFSFVQYIEYLSLESTASPKTMTTPSLAWKLAVQSA